MKTINKIAIAGLTGLALLAGCSQIKYPELIGAKINEQNERRITSKFPGENIFCLHYDVDGRDVSDTIICYNHIVKTNGVYFIGPIAKAYDKNHNKKFEDEEWEFYDKKEEQPSKINPANEQLRKEFPYLRQIQDYDI